MILAPKPRYRWAPQINLWVRTNRPFALLPAYLRPGAYTSPVTLT